MKNIDSIYIKSFKGLNNVEIKDCGKVNAFIGKNNSGKSSILHAIDMAGLALNVSDWGRFQPKLEIKDLFHDTGEFRIEIKFEDSSNVSITTHTNFAPRFNPSPSIEQKFKSVLISPGAAASLLTRRHNTPQNIMSRLENRNMHDLTALDLLFAVKFYSNRNEKGMEQDTYDNLIKEIIYYFPELNNVVSDRTEQDLATLRYEEYGKEIDILYSGTGLKHFIEILVHMTLTNAKVVLIDEPEMGLHPDLQRRFIEYICKIAEEKDIQFFLSTHSSVFLNYADRMNLYRVINKNGEREVIIVHEDGVHTLLSDMGIKPSDIFNSDICLMVEGADDVIFFEYILQTFYKNDIGNLVISVVQFGGSAAEGIISGSINIGNIVPAQKYTFWVRDRDAKLGENPATNSTQFINAIKRASCEGCILNKREIEYYYPEEVHKAAQQGCAEAETESLKVLKGDQSEKFKKAAHDRKICVPKGKNLKMLLQQHFTSKSQLDPEIIDIIENKILPWKKIILG